MATNPVDVWRVASAVTVVTLALGLAACGGGRGDAEQPPTAPGDKATALQASRAGELTQYLQDRLRAREAARAAGNGAFYGAGTTDFGFAPGVTAAPPAAAPARSGSLQQEAGVDEPDLLQSDGQALYTLQPQGLAQVLKSYRRHDDGSVTALKTLPLGGGGENGSTPQGMVLSDDHKTLVALSQRWFALPMDPACGPTCMPVVGLPPSELPFAPIWVRQSVQVQRVDVSQPAAPTAGELVQIDGRLIDSRRIGDALYVISAHVPRLPVDALPTSTSRDEREATINKLNAADVLPTVRRNGGAPTPLLADTDCWVQPGNGSLAVEITTVTVFDLRSPTLAATSRCFVGGTEAVYLTTKNLYLATTRWTIPAAGSNGITIGELRYPSQITTSIHKFSIASGTPAYRSSGEVLGHLGWNPQLKSYRLSESGDLLRVLTYTGRDGWAEVADTKSPSPARLSVLREAGGGTASASLQEVASLPNTSRPALLGKVGEQVYGVRFVGDRGYLVTFRRTDPLYVLDLSNPTDPKIAGALEVPGFSEHLFPLAGGLLLGVGRDADDNGRATGVKVALFDVNDATQPRLAGSIKLGELGSQSALDVSRHGLNLFDKAGVVRVGLPMNLYSSSNASAPWTRGLQRFEVDTAARRLRQLPALGTGPLTGSEPLWLERSVQVGDFVYYANGAGVQGFGW